MLAGTVKINHYDDSSDLPAWIDEGFADGSLTRYIAGLDGGTVGYIQTANTYTITRHYLTDLHGDIKTSSDPAPAGGTPNGATYDTDEYGTPYTGTRRYTWLGDHQRSTDALASTFLMGVRIYAPTLGRFLTGDPVYGGNDNTYTYPLDPINQLDLDGRCAVCVLAPAAAAGPPGWVVLGIAAVLTVGMGAGAYAVSRSRSQSIPKPQATRYKIKKTYTVYEIHQAAGKKRTYKYGITSTKSSRPKSQLGKCQTYYKSSCTWRTVRVARGYFAARQTEYSLIWNYRRTHGSCPPGQRWSCK